MSGYQDYLVDIRLYKATALISAFLLLTTSLLAINTPEAKIGAVIRNYFDALLRVNLTNAIPYTTGQLRQNLTAYREQLEQSAVVSGYSGSMRDITINIVELRDNYAKASVTVLSNIRTNDIPHSIFERFFDVELALVNGEWRIVTSIQRSFNIYDVNN